LTKALPKASFCIRGQPQLRPELQEYAEAAEEQTGQRRLFADDAAHGFAFIELCQQRYDVVLMNPPFGEASLASRDYLYEVIAEAARDVFAGLLRGSISV